VCTILRVSGDKGRRPFFGRGGTKRECGSKELLPYSTLQRYNIGSDVTVYNRTCADAVRLLKFIYKITP
jgi:hypothetical protein